MVGSMETTIKNFAAAATKVQASRTFGALVLVIRIGTTNSEARTANKGFIDMIVSI
jgi:hypothetical protein